MSGNREAIQAEVKRPINGCHNRDKLRDTVIVQSGWRDGYNSSRMPVMIEIKDPMTKDCQYSKLHNDLKCKGCKWQQ